MILKTILQNNMIKKTPINRKINIHYVFKISTLLSSNLINHLNLKLLKPNINSNN